MTWTKLSDDFADRRELRDLSPEDRWHYLALILFCSRGGYTSGVLRRIDACRASDHPDPELALDRLAAVGLLDVDSVEVRLLEIDDHIPPPSVRQKAEADKLRKRRQRAHERGDHGLCLVDNCPDASTVTEHVTPPVTRDPGTGQDRQSIAFPLQDANTPSQSRQGGSYPQPEADEIKVEGWGWINRASVVDALRDACDSRDITASFADQVIELVRDKARVIPDNPTGYVIGAITSEPGKWHRLSAEYRRSAA